MDGIVRLAPAKLSIVFLLPILGLSPGVSAQQDVEQSDDAAQSDVAADQQEGGEGAGPAEEEVEAAEKWTAPETFDSLLEEFRTLVGEITGSGGNTMLHDEKVRGLREKVTTFNDERQPSELSTAVEIQLLLWANDYSAARDTAFSRLDAVAVTDPGVRILWAQHLKERQFKYEKAVEVLDGGEIDLAKHPIAAVIRAEGLVPQNRFDEAETALNSIPPGARVRPELLDRIYFQRQQIAELQEEWRGEAAIREAEATADDLPRIALETTRGTMIIELYENEAPNTVANFISLVDRGFYNQSVFYNVVPNSFIGAGDPVVRADEGVEGAAPAERLPYQLPVELPKAADVDEDSLDTGEAGSDATEQADPSAQEDGDTLQDPSIPLPERSRDHFAGVLSMERAGDNIDPSRFIITLRRRADRDGRSVAFGRVIEGMSIAREITGDDHIVSASVLRKRDHEYTAMTIAIDPEQVAPAQPDPAGEAEGEDESPDDENTRDETGDSGDTSEGAGDHGENGM